MNSINKLIEAYSKFPGIGPRQAKRFVYFLLTRNGDFLEEMSRLLLELKKSAVKCKSCMRFFINTSQNKICDICENPNRDNQILMIVEKDADFENIEKSKIYNGKYFILGGKVPILEKNPEQKIQAKELVNIILQSIKNNNLKEIVLALPINPDGENTEQYIKKLISPIAEKYSIKVSMLGRGLSTGIELEYPDSDTLKNAFKNRV